MKEPVAYPRHPAHLNVFVEELGPELAVRFLIQFGGARLYFPDDPKGKSQAEALIGANALRRLGQRMLQNRAEIPTGTTWVIQALAAEGKGTSEICRILRVTARTVRSARKAMKVLPPPTNELPELPLFAAARNSGCK
ncbi:helix-turn-helix domain-containing protein [Mameliella alba]|nr:helix-turn-helix domain-containing protein [Antarctobacter heliothermus]MBY6147300.1 helix-turn-helix domain-containing protein [Mameliella alba]MCA0957378.1 helix-turn-helix domain-containing protein [Mameliella alba]